MSSRYVRVPNPSDRHHHELDDEVEAAFDYREGDDDDDRTTSESQPLNHNTSQVPPSHTRTASHAPSNVPGTYNFETVDYDYPPPGSPPPLSAHALPNDYGNSNGMVPDFDSHPVLQPRRPWWKRTAANVLPSSVAGLLGVSNKPAGSVGGGTNNDGVFANVTAKPTPPVLIQNGDETYLVPEDSQQEAPPSYASAQADAVPPYWETTIHAPFSPEAMGEMIVDSLPTGSMFAFCWNMLVSISFQFIGFLLTYLLHTSHAARLGSRAGLGVTLIQYGFALRGRLDDTDGTDGFAEPRPTFGSSAEADAWTEAHRGLANFTSTPTSIIPIPEGDQSNIVLADATAEWLSFFLMTIGWFVLLTSVLGFYRVKRWERSILASQEQRGAPAAVSAGSSSIDATFALRGMSRIELLRSGLGLRRNSDSDDARGLARAESGAPVAAVADPSDPSEQDMAQALERERRLIGTLRSGGLI